MLKRGISTLEPAGTVRKERVILSKTLETDPPLFAVIHTTDIYRESASSSLCG